MPAAGAEAGPAWRYEPVGDYRVPEVASTRTLQERLHAAWRRLRPGTGPDPDAADADPDRPRDGGASLVLEADWEDAVRAVEEPLARLGAGGPGGVERVAIVGPPGSGVGEVLARWSEGRGLATWRPPSRSELLEGRAPDLPETGGGPLVVPELHRCFVRNPAGLAVVARLLASFRDRRIRVVAGCDSWTWAYLSKVLHVDAVLTPAFASAALPGPALRDWLSASSAGDRRLRFRFGDADGPVFPSDEDRAPDEEVAGTSDAFFEALAARARGIPGVALRLWTNALTEDGDGSGAAGPEAGVRAGGSAERRLVVHDPSCSDPLVVPLDPDRVGAIVLHTLLLHGGLSEDLLRSVLPFRPPRLVRSLHELRTARVVDEAADEWSVRIEAYPTVREVLAREGFLVDAF